MPSYTQYLRQMSVVVDSSDEDITWITVKGNHIPIKKGQNKGDAIKEFFESKKSGGSKSDKGATSKSAPAKSESKSAGTKTKKEYPHEFETVRKNALANPLLYNHRYTQKSKAEAYKEYQETAGNKTETKSNKHDQLKKLGKEIVEHRKKWNEANELLDKGAFKDKTESHKEAIKRGGEELAKKEKEYEKLHAELTGGEKKSESTSAKTEKKKPEFNEEEFERSSMKGMIESVLAYHGGAEADPKHLVDTVSYLKQYVDRFGEKAVIEEIKKTQSRIDRIERDVHTDSEGVSYNSIIWKKDEPKAESKPLGTYEYHTDPGHGWLKVPMKEIEELGIKISEFSYQDGDFGYLEEDLDAGTFMRAYKEKYGTDPEHTTHHSDNWSHIREMKRFPKPKED